MIDCHSHILPHFDDGAKDTETALKMLADSRRQGVTEVISTSHCYPKCEADIRSFAAARNESFERLNAAAAECDYALPKLYPAAELNMLTDVSEYDGLSALCINGTNYILIEMPMLEWKEWMIEAVYKLTIKNFKPIMAHIDRYLDRSRTMLASLHELDVLYQLNTDAVIDPHMRVFAFELIEKGRAHILGTDMHNLTSRGPNMKAACDILEKHFGAELTEYFDNNARTVLGKEGEIKTVKFKRKSVLKRILKK